MYKAIINARENSKKPDREKAIQQLADTVVKMSKTLDGALSKPKHFIELKPNLWGLGVDLHELGDRLPTD